MNQSDMIRPVDTDTRRLADLLFAASAWLVGESDAVGPARDLLERCGYFDGRADLAPHRAALLRAAARFRRIFTLDAVDAPGLVVVGAEVDPGLPGAPIGNVAGTGITFGRAFESCVGEGVEYLSQFTADSGRFIAMADDDALRNASPHLTGLWNRLRPYRAAPEATTADWISAADLSDGQPVLVPVDLCFRRPSEARDVTPPWPLSTGCGAGRERLDATLHGLLELIERDAVALWWRGGRRPRLVPSGIGAERLALLRQGPSQRRTWLLDVTSDLGVPTVVAASCQDDGFGFCCGHAARPTMAQAADAAMMELAQLELACRLASTKRTVRGDTALNDTDRRHIRRFTQIAVPSTLALHPTAPPAPPDDLPVDDLFALLASLRQRLAKAGLAPCAVDLTREEWEVPSVRVLCPGLEAGLTGPGGPRLAAAAALSGTNPDTCPDL